LANEYVCDVTIPTQVIKYSQNFLREDQPIRLQYSNQIKLQKMYSEMSLKVVWFLGTHNTAIHNW